jgi:hypothetical protein
VLLSHLDERQRRLTLASEAAELGRGGIKTVTEAASSLVLLGFGSDRQSVWETARSERDEPAGLRTVPPDDDVKVLVTASLPPGRLITYRSIMPVDPEASERRAACARHVPGSGTGGAAGPDGSTPVREHKVAAVAGPHARQARRRRGSSMARLPGWTPRRPWRRRLPSSRRCSRRAAMSTRSVGRILVQAGRDGCPPFAVGGANGLPLAAASTCRSPRTPSRLTSPVTSMSGSTPCSMVIDAGGWPQTSTDRPRCWTPCPTSRLPARSELAGLGVLKVLSQRCAHDFARPAVLCGGDLVEFRVDVVG